MTLIDEVGAGSQIMDNPLCPVCRWPTLGGEAVCRICNWRLIGEWIAGPASSDDNCELADRLAMARQVHDLRAAARSMPVELRSHAHRMSVLTGLVRGGSPSAERLDQIIAEVSAKDRSVQTTTAGTGFALARLLAGEVDAVAFLEIGPDGAAVQLIAADDKGVPQPVAEPSQLPWQLVMPRLSGDRSLRRFQLAGGIGITDTGDSRLPKDSAALAAAAMTGDQLKVAFEQLLGDAFAEMTAVGLPEPGTGRDVPRLDTVLIRRTCGFSMLEFAAVRAQLAIRPVADIYQPADAGSLKEIVRQIAGRTPLRFSYELILVSVDPLDGAVAFDEYELFPAGAVAKPHSRPEQVELVAPLHAAPELTLPIVARRGEKASDWPVIHAIAMSGTAVGSTKLSVSLLGPGTVAIQSTPKELGPSAESPRWPNLLDQLPRYLPRSGPLDIAFLIELAGHQIEVDNRLTLVRGVVDYLAAASSAPTVRVALVGYRDHFSLTHHANAEDEDRRLVIFHPLDSIDSTRALLAPRNAWEAVPEQHYQAAPVEDALSALWEDQTSWRPGARHMLVLVGSRPPHPPVTGATGRDPQPCPYRHDWKHDLDQMRLEHDIECVSVVSGKDGDSITHYAQNAWNELGSDGLFTAGKGDMDRLVQSVGLMANAATARLTLASERRPSH